MDYKDSAGLPVMGSLPLCDEESLVPMPCVPSDCWMTEEGVMLGGSGTGSLPQFGLGTNHYYTPNFVFLPIIKWLLKACLEGIGGSVVGNLLEWLTCIIGALIRGYPLKEASSACGGFPVNGCELLAGCLGGILGGPVGKWIPKLKDIAEELVGWLTSGLCRGLTLPPPPCNPPSPSPRPKPGHSMGGSWPIKVGQLPAI